MQVMGLYPANSIFIGDYLTTQGATARADLEMIRDAGFVLETPDGAAFEGDPFAALPESYPRAPLPLVTVSS
jgi:biotin synthase